MKRGVAIAVAVAGVAGAALLASQLLPRTPAQPEKPAVSGLPASAGPAGPLDCRDCNLVIVSMTNLRKDHLKAYGYERETTPILDRYFANALVFRNTFGPSSWTLPVAASLFTSLFPYSHGLMSRADMVRVPDEVLPLGMLFRARGYHSAGFTGGADYNRRFNIARGFDTWVDEKTYSDYGIIGRAGAIGPDSYLGVRDLVPVATRWVEENRDRKMLLLLQGFDVHCPFTPAPPYDGLFGPPYQGEVDFRDCLWTFGETRKVGEGKDARWPVKTWWKPSVGVRDVTLSDDDVTRMIALYDGEIAQTDALLAPLFETFKRLGLERKTVFLFISEHGDLFGEHGRFMRGGAIRGTFYQPVLAFPMLLKHPRITERRQIDGLVQAVDLLPTLVEIFGLEDPQASRRQGKSLVPLINEGKQVNERAYAAARFVTKKNIFFQGVSEVDAVRDQRWKLIRERTWPDDQPAFATTELYDLQADPLETTDVRDAHPEIVRDLGRSIDEAVARMKAEAVTPIGLPDEFPAPTSPPSPAQAQ